MRENLPVSEHEHEFADSELLVSFTDVQGRITHCNRAFVQVSGYAYDELIGQPHNLIRHPTMPPEAFEDMWRTIGRGRPWSGIVKNRRANGDHYWVRANVAPIVDNGKPVAYMSVRNRPSRLEVQAAEQLYARLARERASGRRTIELHAGRVRHVGWRDLPQRVHRLDLSQRLALALGLVVAATTLASLMHGQAAAGTVAVCAAACSVAVWSWFHIGIQRRLDALTRFAGLLAGSNLKGSIEPVHPHPLSQLTRALIQVQLNLRAVVGHAREEVDGTAQSLAEIARGTHDLSSRTEAQASSLEQTAASMEQFAATVKQTAENARTVSRQSADMAGAADDSARAIEAMAESIQAQEQSSRRVGDIVKVIETIAFKTNVLALNAAIEAARAGDAGKGFAVVAAEVRALAQSCARSAKEIGEVIKTSTRQVEEGTQRTSAAGQTILRTRQAAHEVSHLIDQITSATAEQTGGIGQVNQAVGELDRVTQANAALVEQTAAVTESLNRRTATLKRSVAMYRL